MKSQKHNQGELKELTIKVEKKVAEDFEQMAKNTNIPLADLIVTAMKRFRASHSDFMKNTPNVD